jgi:hypothetical protein
LHGESLVTEILPAGLIAVFYTWSHLPNIKRWLADKRRALGWLAEKYFISQ